MMSNVEDQQELSYDSDDALFLTAVIKCEQEYQDNEVTIVKEDVYYNDEEDADGNWSSEDTFLQICNEVEVEDIKVKSEYSEEKDDSQSISDSDLLFVAALVEGDNDKPSPSLLSPDYISQEVLQFVENSGLTQQDEVGEGNGNMSPSLLVSHQESGLVYTQPEETTDVEDQNGKEMVIPEPPRKLYKKRARNINHDKIIHHEVKTIRSESSSLSIKDFGDVSWISKSVNRNAATGKCPSDCSDCNTDSEVVMGFNTRDIVLMTSSSEESNNHDKEAKHIPQPSPLLDVDTENASSDNTHKSRKVQEVSSDSSNIGSSKKILKRARKRKMTNGSERKFLSESSESEFSCENKNQARKSHIKKRLPNKKRKTENRRTKKRLSNGRRSRSSSSNFIKDTSSESESSSSSNPNLRSRSRRPYRLKLGQTQNKSLNDDVEERSSMCSPNRISSIERLVKESSPFLKLVLEDIGPKLLSNKGSKNKLLIQSQSPTPPSRKITRSAKNRKQKEFESDNDDDAIAISTDEISGSEEEIKTYTRSRRVKPGPKYRYRNRHTGDTDEETDDGNSSSKFEIEFETDSGSSSSGTSVVNSEDISDPDENDETEDPFSKECIVCSTLGSTIVKGRSRIGNPYWCKCGHCAISSCMMRDYDRVCCRELTKVLEFMDDELEISSQENFCITMHPRFLEDVVGFKAYFRTQKNAFFCSKTATESKRVYYAKLSFIRWIFNRLGPDNRIMPPACVIRAIRVALMDNPNDPNYVPFKPVKFCDSGVHCRAALGLPNKSNN